MMAIDADDEFQKELVELFAQEAQEWLGQADAALSELESRPPADRHLKLVEVIARGLTNLGGSAATVNLPDIEQATFALLPSLEHFRNPDAVIQSDRFTSFRRDLREIAAAIQKHASAASTRVLGDDVEDNDEMANRPATLLNALKELQAASGRTSKPSRNLTAVVIHKLERDLQEGVVQLDVSSLRTLLEELHKMDEHLLETLRSCIPAITQSVTRLKETLASGAPPDQELNETIRTVQDLRETAKAAQADPIVTFLTGLQSFLTVVAKRQVVLPRKRIEAVASRLPAVLTMAQQWVAIGQSERAAIGKLLPA